MFTIILTISVIFLIIFNLYINDYDLFAPSTLTTSMFFISSILLLAEMYKWDVAISGYTFFVILLGLVTYSFVGLIFVANYKSKRLAFSNISKKKKSDPIIVNKWIIVLIIAFEVVVGISYYRDVKSLAEQLMHYNSLAEMISTYRKSISFEGSHIEGTISQFSRHGLNFCLAISYVFIFALIKNRIEDNKIKKSNNILMIIAIIIPGCISLLGGGRNIALSLFFEAITLYFLLQKLCNTNRKNSIKNYKKLFIILIFMTILFSLMGRFVGRSRSISLFDYIAKYIGAPIKLFDMFLKNPDNTEKIVAGQETFVNFWKYIGRLTGNARLQNLIMNKKYRTINGYNLGNVYTAFREYYSDFGIGGVIILTAIHSLFYSIFYYNIKYRTDIDRKKVNTKIIIYGYYSQALYYFSIDDRFYQALISTQTVEILVYIVIISFLLNSKYRLKLH